MLAVERQQRILYLLNEQKTVKVTELSEFFSVTEETIRRDLEKLENEKKLARSYGGAVSVQEQDDMEIPYTERKVINRKEKMEIAHEAVKQVVDGDTIILDASTTAWYMAKALPNIPITVLTNSIQVVMALSRKKEMTVISAGGVLLPDSLSYVGPLAEASIGTYRVNKAFISCKGLHFERGLSELDERQALIKKKMIACAESTFLMLDHSKFGVQAFSRITGLDEICHVITDSKVSKEITKRLAEKSLNHIKVCY
ncbi:DeoR/GlpR family DNA-binding transcription regulator [Sediminibacillus massiliensis]|uniref:DeoR/GlpR family DNA-binding transcription regulator n=1 Tax=Sediminibacillus massiliensis TaxID=1926277 RepID=UPI0009886706|nr:DeoR/GlpR family DNA-binding transcription regulator [Sediminibacillus massiliensis]